MKNLLWEQILSFKNRPHVIELHHPMRQTETRASIYNIIVGKEAGTFIRSGVLIWINTVFRLKFSLIEA